MWLLELLITVVLSAHLLCMNVSTAGPLICIWLEWREGRGSVMAGRAGRYLATASIALLVLGAILGLVLGWLIWSPSFRDVLVSLGHRVAWGVAELVFSGVLLAGQVVWWSAARRAGWLQRGLRIVLLLAAGTNLMYHFPFLFVVISDMTAGGVAAAEPIESARFLHMMVQGGVLARTTHFWVASLAMAGLALVMRPLWFRQRPHGRLREGRTAVWGARIALAATLAQIPVGTWLLVQLPRNSQQQLLGGDLLTTSLFAVSILLALVLMHQLAALAMGSISRSALWAPVITAAVVVVLMCATLRAARPHVINLSGPAKTTEEVDGYRVSNDSRR